MGSFLTKDWKELFEDSKSTSKPNYRARTLSIDPRSPTSDITRTPIQVESSPEHILDPRSPSANILRTPIFVPDDSIVNDNGFNSSEAIGFKFNDQSEIKDIETFLKCIEDDSKFSRTSTPEKRRNNSTSLPDTTDILEEEMIEIKSPVEIKVKKQQPHLKLDEIKRSPLATCNFSHSPRQILQRRQVNKINENLNKQSNYSSNKENAISFN